MNILTLSVHHIGRSVGITVFPFPILRNIQTPASDSIVPASTESSTSEKLPVLSTITPVIMEAIAMTA